MLLPKHGHRFTEATTFSELEETLGRCTKLQVIGIMKELGMETKKLEKKLSNVPKTTLSEKTQAELVKRLKASRS